MGCTNSSEPKQKDVFNDPPRSASGDNKSLAGQSLSLKSFKLGKVLGEGQFAQVYLATNNVNNQQYALKCMDKSKMSEEERTGLAMEIQILSEITHPHIMSLYGSFEESGKVYLVTELIEGGELFDRIVSKDPPHYSEKSAQSTVRMLLEAIAYLHSKGICHRDLKPENLLLMSMTDDNSAKIADFGFAAKPADSPGGELTDGVGTPGYVAPEIIKLPRKHGLPCDIWSLGVIVYILICGYPPFFHENDNQLFNLICKGKYEFDPSDWSGISDDCKDFIQKMIVVSVSKRWTAEQLLRHSWMTSAEVSDEHRDAALAALKSFKAKQRWRKAGNAVRATVRMKNFMELAHSLTAAEDVDVTVE